ncbi:MAG: hypothetical protein KME50_26060 [Nostoc desertorum CM1-VF14]|jgi:uncharacterized phage infection (PIP) family protein YhgE|nr:hypothetical protein [Nostoc desertorum CM1-VF14]
MTNTPNQPSRLELIEAILVRVATQQEINTTAIAGLTAKQEVNTTAISELTTKLDNLSDNIAELTSNVNTVLARSGVLDDVLLELRDSHEQHEQSYERHQQNFLEHQRTSNAALQSLEAILLQLLRIFPQQ